MEAEELVIDESIQTDASFLVHMFQLDAVNGMEFHREFEQWVDSPKYKTDLLIKLAEGVGNGGLENMFAALDNCDSYLDSDTFELVKNFGSRLLGTRKNLSKLRSFMSLFTNADDLRDLIRDHLNIDYCPDCDEFEYNVNTREIWGGDYVCRDCIDNSYTYSDYHDAYVNDHYTRTALDAEGNEVTVHESSYDFAYSEIAGMYVHEDHPDHPNNRDREPDLIGAYHSSKASFKPQPDNWTLKNNRFFGVELEVVHNDAATHQAATIIHETVNLFDDAPVHGLNVFFERDGSLGNAGFEMITQPMSLPAHRKLWSFLKDKSKVRGLRSHKTSNCGLHVHVSRTGMTKLQIAKLVTFINNPKHEDFIRAIARRYENGYCNIKPKKIGSAAQSIDRYEAVNLTPRHTIEFRLFKGTLKYESLIAAVEFTNALIEFCKPTQTSINDLTADAFMRFMEEKIPHETEFVRPYIKNNLESE